MTAAPAARYRPLGAFRFFLALLVVLQHFQHLLPPAERAVFSKMGFGAIAVAVFFAVSGFVVAEANATFYAGRPGAFLANRAVRLVPPYLAALVLSVVVHAVLWQGGRLVLWDYSLAVPPWTPSCLLSGLLGLLPGFSPHWLGVNFEFIPFVWTLRLEVAFYIIAAVVLAACVRARDRWPAALAICAALLISAAYLWFVRRPSFLSTTPMFLFGNCLFLFSLRKRWGRAALCGLAALLSAAGFASWQWPIAGFPSAQYCALALLLAIFAMLAMRHTLPKNQRFDRWLGDLSYPLYLNHYAVGILFASCTDRLSGRLYAAGVACAVLLSWFAGRCVDRPLQSLRDRIRSRPIR